MTLDVVARAAGVSKPTLYRRWRSKAELTVAALIRHYGAEPVSDNGSLREDLLQAQRHTAALLGDPTTVHILSALLADLSRDPELNRTWKDGFLAPRRRSFQAALDRARTRGEWPRDISSTWAADWLTGPLLSHVLLSREPLAEDDVTETVDRFLRAFSAGT
jgi:AcrR family transcriptional regulator